MICFRVSKRTLKVKKKVFYNLVVIFLEQFSMNAICMEKIFWNFTISFESSLHIFGIKNDYFLYKYRNIFCIILILMEWKITAECVLIFITIYKIIFGWKFSKACVYSRNFIFCPKTKKRSRGCVLLKRATHFFRRFLV